MNWKLSAYPLRVKKAFPEKTFRKPHIIVLPVRTSVNKQPHSAKIFFGIRLIFPFPSPVLYLSRRLAFRSFFPQL
jgi:hypothetical protein